MNATHHLQERNLRPSTTTHKATGAWTAVAILALLGMTLTGLATPAAAHMQQCRYTPNEENPGWICYMDIPCVETHCSVPCLDAPCPPVPPVPCVDTNCNLPCVDYPCPSVPCVQTDCGIPCWDTDCPPIECVDTDCVPSGIPCYNAPCPYVPCLDYDCVPSGLPQVNVRILGTIQQVTDTVDGGQVPEAPPVAYIGTVRLLIGGAKIPAVGVGVTGPCDAYENVLPCELNPLVPPTELFANSVEIEPDAVDVPNLCLQSALLTVDVNADSYNEAEVPTPWVGPC